MIFKRIRMVQRSLNSCYKTDAKHINLTEMPKKIGFGTRATISQRNALATSEKCAQKLKQENLRWPY